MLYCTCFFFWEHRVNTIEYWQEKNIANCFVKFSCVLQLCNLRKAVQWKVATFEFQPYFPAPILLLDVQQPADHHGSGSASQSRKIFWVNWRPVGMWSIQKGRIFFPSETWDDETAKLKRWGRRSGRFVSHEFFCCWMIQGLLYVMSLFVSGIVDVIRPLGVEND